MRSQERAAANSIALFPSDLLVTTGGRTRSHLTMTHPANKRARDCAQLMLEARNRAQLDELKARFDETTTRQAWNALTPLEQARVKATADTTQLTIADAPAAPPPKRTLFRLGEELAQLDARIDAFEGELEEGSEPLQEIDRFIQTKTETLEEFSQKVDDYCSLIAMRKASAAAREAEAKRLQELAERDRRLADRLSETLKAVLAARGCHATIDLKDRSTIHGASSRRFFPPAARLRS